VERSGGQGKENLKKFYRDHFISKLPADTKVQTISRTVDHERLVEELLFCFTHDRVVDFLLPGVPPTGKYVEVPTVAVFMFKDGLIANEHIYWDQASVLVQIGLLDPANLPVCGIESAQKMRDMNMPFKNLDN
jgi:carboxymethylenebutenolidase